MTPGVGPFVPQGHDLNKLGRGYITNIMALCFVDSDKNSLYVFTIKAYVKYVTPGMGSLVIGT